MSIRSNTSGPNPLDLVLAPNSKLTMLTIVDPAESSINKEDFLYDNDLYSSVLSMQKSVFQDRKTNPNKTSYSLWMLMNKLNYTKDICYYKVYTEMMNEFNSITSHLSYVFNRAPMPQLSMFILAKSNSHPNDYKVSVLKQYIADHLSTKTPNYDVSCLYSTLEKTRKCNALGNKLSFNIEHFSSTPNNNPEYFNMLYYIFLKFMLNHYSYSHYDSDKYNNSVIRIQCKSEGELFDLNGLTIY